MMAAAQAQVDHSWRMVYGLWESRLNSRNPDAALAFGTKQNQHGNFATRVSA